jgi:hypothetical protein
MNRYRLTTALSAALLAGTLGAAGPADAQAPPGVRVDLKVLVVTDGGPNTTAIADQLRTDGIPFDTVDLNRADRPVLRADLLADTAGPQLRAKYQAVVLPNSNPFTDPAEAAALFAYERQFGIRQVDAYLWPTPAVGLNYPAYSGQLDGTVGAATAAGLAGPFRYLRGAVPFEDNDPARWETYGFLSQPMTADFTPLVTTTSPDGSTPGVLVGELRADNREQLVMTFSANSAQQQFRLLAPGIVNWMTRGTHLGHHRNYLSVHVDDVLVGDNRWHVAGNCTPGEDCRNGETTTDIRMTPADVQRAVQWQADKNFTLDMVYNAAGSAEAEQNTPGGVDPLTAELTARKDAFRWTNHTYTHAFLGCAQDVGVVPWRCATNPDGSTRWTPEAAIRTEITTNRDWATRRGFPLDPAELVTGEHSGLKVLPQQPDHNPNLGPAVDGTGIGWLAADNSRMPEQIRVGAAYTVPRHPLNIFFNVATAAEEVDEYNWIYTSRALGGSGICDDNPATTTCITPLDPATGWTSMIVPQETRMALSRVLGNDPRPHFVHQSNLAEDRLLYPVLDGVLDTYRSLLNDNTPIVCERMSANGAALKRQAAWRSAAAGVTAYIRDGVVTVEAPAGVQVPLTVPEGSHTAGNAFGEPYAGERSAWITGGAVVTVP